MSNNWVAHAQVEAEIIDLRSQAQDYSEENNMLIQVRISFILTLISNN